MEIPAEFHELLSSQAVAFVATIGKRGEPQVTPIWFLWDGERVLAFSKPHARKVENLRHDPHVMLAVGTPGPDFDVELIEADAELPATPTAELMPSGFGKKYAELLRHAGLSVQRFMEVYSQPIVMRPTRFLGYGGRGWEPSAQLAS